LIDGRASVYIETSVVSYMTARPSRDLVSRTRQKLTREWWETRRDQFVLVTSQLTLAEARQGDSEMVKARLEALSGLQILAVTDEVEAVADTVLRSGIVPPGEPADAFHPAICMVHEVDFLLTWNCRHLANPHTSTRRNELSKRLGYSPVVVCTTEGL
jgi:hypothetical protein